MLIAQTTGMRNALNVNLTTKRTGDVKSTGMISISGDFGVNRNEVATLYRKNKRQTHKDSILPPLRPKDND